MISLPPEFKLRMQSLLQNEYLLFEESLNKSSPVSIRLNPFKRINEFDTNEKIPWSENGRYLEKRPSFTYDPLFHAGTYYVQEASSQYIEQFLLPEIKNKKNLRVLDLCAAPGGKSTHIISLIGEDDLLISNEIIPSRNKILRQNISKWGKANVIVSQNESKDFSAFKNYFDIILVDAPCSGEGLFRKDEDATNEWSEENVRLCSVRQKNILNEIIPCLKTGGLLIYCTCTYEKEENEIQIQQAIEEHDLSLIEFPVTDNNILRTEYGLRLYPHKIKGEGFFISAFRKNNREDAKKMKSHSIHKNEFGKIINQFLVGDYIPVNFKNHLFALSEKFYSDYKFLNEKLFIRQTGIYCGELKNSDFIPSGELALSFDLKKDIDSLQLSEEQAIDFLKGNQVKSGIPEHGWKLASCKRFNLGWMKFFSNRMNNYYPNEWRIRQ